ncbi:FAM172 family protein homolog [Nematostella vectensis]|uniref:FAM172 family protein homolog n=1 Tax=Nematostella vectensis TaxID=45351 RepID=UPI00138FDBFC|nr:FAM172 family protein homolog [Nematostella vectensis]
MLAFLVTYFQYFLLLLCMLNVDTRLKNSGPPPSTAEPGFCNENAYNCGEQENMLPTGLFKAFHQATKPDFYKFKTIEEFGYHFNERGQLRSIQTGEPFMFEVKPGDRQYNQNHYEALGEVITDHVYKLLEEKAGLKRVYVPIDPRENESVGFIFMSEDALRAEKLMILIHGSGVVRAGQWARSLIINDCLESGTMLSYIARARKEGYGVLVTNGNENTSVKKGKMQRIRGSESPESHFDYVWNTFISKAAASSIVIVAHSYGGVVVVHGMKRCPGAMSRVKAVAFTDSVHTLHHQGADNTLRDWFQENTRNWVSSGLPLDTPITSRFSRADSDLVSAGTTQHVLTSHYAFNSVFNFFDEKLNRKRKRKISPLKDKTEQKQSLPIQSEGETPEERKVDQPMGNEEKTTMTHREYSVTDGNIDERDNRMHRQEPEGGISGSHATPDTTQPVKPGVTHSDVICSQATFSGKAQPVQIDNNQTEAIETVDNTQSQIIETDVTQSDESQTKAIKSVAPSDTSQSEDKESIATYDADTQSEVMDTDVTQCDKSLSKAIRSVAPSDTSQSEEVESIVQSDDNTQSEVMDTDVTQSDASQSEDIQLTTQSDDSKL